MQFDPRSTSGRSQDYTKVQAECPADSCRGADGAALVFADDKRPAAAGMDRHWADDAKDLVVAPKTPILPTGLRDDEGDAPGAV